MKVSELLYLDRIYWEAQQSIIDIREALAKRPKSMYNKSYRGQILHLQIRQNVCMRELEREGLNDSELKSLLQDTGIVIPK